MKNFLLILLAITLVAAIVLRVRYGGGDQQQKLSTVIQSSRIRWADGMSSGPAGWLYLADSALPELVLKSNDHIKTQGPYFIFRFNPGYDAAPE